MKTKISVITPPEIEQRLFIEFLKVLIHKSLKILNGLFVMMLQMIIR